MALTLKCNRTGRAASTDRRDTIEYIHDQQNKSIDQQAWRERESAAIKRCVELAGEESFLEWYDNDANVPDYGLISERVAILEKRVRELEEEHNHDL